MLKTIIKDINATYLLAINEEDIPVSSLQKKRKGNEESEEPGESSPTPTLRFNILLIVLITYFNRYTIILHC